MAQIVGPMAERLSAALLDAFTPERFDQLLYYKLARLRTRISMARNFDSIVFDVIVAAGSEGWLDTLVLAARQSRPDDVALAAAARELGLGPTISPALESIIHERAPMIDPGQWRRRLAQIEGCICRVENAGGPGSLPLGTGFLIGPDLCLTAFHIVEGLFDKSLPAEDLILRFDYVRDSTGKEVYPGSVFRLARDWMVASFPYSDQEKSRVTTERLPAPSELDVVILRVADSPGEQPVGKAEPKGQARGWLSNLSRFPPTPGDDLLILQHPQGGPLQLAFGKVLELNANQTRINHDVNTAYGSSGSPCFSIALDLVAVHQAGDQTYGQWQLPRRNRSIPILTVQSLLRDQNTDLQVFLNEADA